jgi:hypothetical protein
MDADCNDDHGDKDVRPPRSVMCAPFDRIREFLLNHTFLFSSNDGEFDGGYARHKVASVDPILLHARTNMNPMGALRRRRRGQGRGGRRGQRSDTGVCCDGAERDVPVPSQGKVQCVCCWPLRGGCAGHVVPTVRRG